MPLAKIDARSLPTNLDQYIGQNVTIEISENESIQGKVASQDNKTSNDVSIIKYNDGVYYGPTIAGKPDTGHPGPLRWILDWLFDRPIRPTYGKMIYNDGRIWEGTFKNGNPLRGRIIQQPANRKKESSGWTNAQSTSTPEPKLDPFVGDNQAKRRRHDPKASQPQIRLPNSSPQDPFKMT